MAMPKHVRHKGGHGYFSSSEERRRRAAGNKGRQLGAR
jgi:hypothetical protein